LILSATLLAPHRYQAVAESRSIYPASLISKKITMMSGTYDAATQTHKLSAPIEIDDIGNWRKFAENIKDLPILKENIDVNDFTKQNFILIKELDKDGFVTGETVFSPGLIQQKIIDLTFKLRSKDSRSFFLDLLEMQMNRASYETPIDQSIKYTDPGIVIRYPLSNILRTPIWRVKDTEEMLELADYFDANGPEYYDITYVYKASIDTIDSYLTNELDTFQIYINLDDPSMPYKICVDPLGSFAISRSSYTRITPDTHNYYRFFSDYFEQLLAAQTEELAPQSAEETAAKESVVEEAVIEPTVTE
tara:strand:- start:71289 stop:72206 length:918 start_codon:yes stop_codon:yes gene_type:complete